MMRMRKYFSSEKAYIQFNELKKKNIEIPQTNKKKIILLSIYT